MTLTGVVIMLIIAGVCGSVGAGLAGYSYAGCLASIALGFIGAWLGIWVAHQLHLPTLWVVRVQGESFPVVWSIVGATMFAGVASVLSAPSRSGS